jgi:alcohol dehydrogenase (cytochrome c)
MPRIRPRIWLTALAGFLVAAMTALAYTGAQAEAGQSLFASMCAVCHGATLGGGMGPALVGPLFRNHWRSAAALFQFVSIQMPLNNPGSLTATQYWDIVSFLLRQNGVPVDDKVLNGESAQESLVPQAG